MATTVEVIVGTIVLASGRCLCPGAETICGSSYARKAQTAYMRTEIAGELSVAVLPLHREMPPCCLRAAPMNAATAAP